MFTLIKIVNSDIVFVPDKPVSGKELCMEMRVDQTVFTSDLSESTWWDIDRRELKFLTPTPSPTILVLKIRYYQKRMGNSEWLDQDPYLRKSMLVTLTRKVSDNFLPEAFYLQTLTMAVLEGSADAEEDLAIGLDPQGESLGQGQRPKAM